MEADPGFATNATARARSGCNQFASDCRTGDIVTGAMPVIKTCVVAGTSAQLKFGGRDSTVYLLSEPCCPAGPQAAKFQLLNNLEETCYIH